MRSYLPAYALRAPETLHEALELLAGEPGRWRPFAGGTDLMVLLEAGALTHREFLSLWRLQELRGIDVSEDEIVFGALTTYTELLRHPIVRAEFPLLCLAAAETGGVATQNRGTLGGNIANASPAADTPPALLVYDAEVDLLSRRGTRRVPYERFHLGYKQMDLRPDELIGAIRVRRHSQPVSETYRKVGTRKAQAISKVCLAARLRMTSDTVADVRIALGSVAPTVIRAVRAEAALLGRPLASGSVHLALDELAADIAPIDDVRSSARYRGQVARNLLKEFLESG